MRRFPLTLTPMTLLCVALLAALALATTSHAAVFNIGTDFNGGLPGNATLFGSANYHPGALTTQTFDGGGTASTIAGSGSTSIQAGGPTGSFFRLMPDIGSQNNRIAFDQTASQVATHIVADFDFRMFTGDAIAGGGTGRADGFGVAFLNTVNHGTTGAGPQFSEEPDVTGSLGVGFDIHGGGGNDGGNTNHISFHNGGFVNRVNLNPGTQIDLANGQFHHATIEAIWTGATTANVIVTLTPDVYGTPGAPVVINQAVAGLAPSASRVSFDGRTGGATSQQDLDNINVDFGPISQGGVQLTPAAGGQLGGMAFDDPSAGIPMMGFDASFDFRVRAGTSSGADGFSFGFVRGNDVGTASETGRASGLNIEFDIHDNGAGDLPANHIEVRFDNTPVAGSLIDLSGFGIVLEDGAIHNASASMDNGLLSVVIDGQTVLSNLAIPGWTPYAGRFNFGGRTGGLNADHYIDNFSASLQTIVPEPMSATMGLMGLTLLALRRRRPAA